MKMEDIRAKSADELKDMMGSLKREMFNLRFQMATGEAGNTSRFREVRRDIARARTALTQQAAGAATSKKAPAKPKASKTKKTNAA